MLIACLIACTLFHIAVGGGRNKKIRKHPSHKQPTTETDFSQSEFHSYRSTYDPLLLATGKVYWMSLAKAHDFVHSITSAQDAHIADLMSDFGSFKEEFIAVEENSNFERSIRAVAKSAWERPIWKFFEIQLVHLLDNGRRSTQVYEFFANVHRILFERLSVKFSVAQLAFETKRNVLDKLDLFERRKDILNQGQNLLEQLKSEGFDGKSENVIILEDVLARESQEIAQMEKERSLDPVEADLLKIYGVDLSNPAELKKAIYTGMLLLRHPERRQRNQLLEMESKQSQQDLESVSRV
jgi:hypothetical protein